MWSHYANNHNGVCLRFDFIDDANILSKLHKVNYSDDMLIVNDDKDFTRSWFSWADMTYVQLVLDSVNYRSE
jgi:meiotically up-regulated gene 157 (Mug157) protein